jgi:hypothetical protein
MKFQIFWIMSQNRKQSGHFIEVRIFKNLCRKWMTRLFISLIFNCRKLIIRSWKFWMWYTILKSHHLSAAIWMRAQNLSRSFSVFPWTKTKALNQVCNSLNLVKMYWLQTFFKAGMGFTFQIEIQIIKYKNQLIRESCRKHTWNVIYWYQKLKIKLAIKYLGLLKYSVCRIPQMKLKKLRNGSEFLKGWHH